MTSSFAHCALSKKPSFLDSRAGRATAPSLPDNHTGMSGATQQATPDLQLNSSIKQPAEAALNTSSLLWGLFFGSAGLGFFIYGKKQKAVVPLACGLALMVFPYFVTNTLLLVLIGFALIALPYFFRV